jgi:DNA-binding transcriptional regulator GbsR (MarR family)
MATPQFILRHSEPTMNPSSDELANVIIHRMGLMPRKKGSTEKIHRILVELYEKAKVASRDKNPTSALITVEEMAMHAGISRQTMYDYIKRWLDMDFISKTSYIGAEQKVIIGYKLNGPTLESAFDKSKTKILNNVDITAKYIGELQRILKNEKISKRFDEKRKDNEQQTLTPEKLETPTIEKKEEDVGAVLSQFF